MDPITAGLAIVGTGMRIFGAFGAQQDAQRVGELNREKAKLELQNEEARHKAALLASRRSQLEIVRNNQRARALAVNNATSQGAQFGSGLAGGLGQISGMTNWNIQGNNQQLQFGNELYETNKGISALNSEISTTQGGIAENQALSQLGGTIRGAAGSLGSMGQSAGGIFSSFGNMFSGGNYSGTPGASNTGGLY